MQGLLLLGNAKETSFFFVSPENFCYGELPLVSDKDSENAQGCLQNGEKARGKTNLWGIVYIFIHL